MRDKHNCLSGPTQPIDAIKAARLKLDVANCQHLIQKKNVLFQVCRNRKSKPKELPRRVCLDRRVNVVTDSGIFQNIFHFATDLASAHSQN